MNPTLKYSLARLGLFVAVALPLVFLAPQVNILLKMMIAVIVSAILAFFFLRGLRDEVAHGMVASRERRMAEKEKLRAALAGEGESAEAQDTAAEDTDAEHSNAEHTDAEHNRDAS
jgi:hypothetical protein